MPSENFRRHPSLLIQPFLFQPAGQMFGHLLVVQIAERKMGVAFDAHFGQVHQRGLAAVFVDGVYPILRQFHAHIPLVAALGAVWRVGDKVAEVDHNRDLREAAEGVGIGFHRGDVAEAVFHYRRHFALREGEVARFVGHHGFDVGVLAGNQPAERAAGGVGNQNAAADFIEQRAHAAGNRGGIGGTGVGGDGAEELLQRGLILRKRYTLVEVRVAADAELGKPELIVGGGFDFRTNCAAAGLSAARLVNQIHGVAFAQEDVLEAFAAVGRGLPSAHGAAVAVQEHQRQAAGAFGDLVEHGGVVAVQGLAAGLGGNLINVPEVVVVAQ